MAVRPDETNPTKTSENVFNEINRRIEGGHGIVPLIVPITLLNHYIRKFQQPYLMQQHYMNPHPIELKLRNHA